MSIRLANAGFSAVLAVALVVCGSCSDGDQGPRSAEVAAASINPLRSGVSDPTPPPPPDERAPEPEQTPVAPQIRWESTEHDFGVIRSEDGPVRHAFRFHHTGATTEHVHILDIRCPCGCTKVEHTASVGPGETGEVVIVYDPSNRQGPDRRACHVKTSDPAQTDLDLTIIVHVDAPVSIEPRALWIGEFPQSDDGKSVLINVLSRDPNFAVTRFDVFAKDEKSEQPTYTITAMGQDRVTVNEVERDRFQYEVQFLGSEEVGRQEARVVFETNRADPTGRPTRLRSTLVAAVHGPLRVTPDILNVAVPASEAPFEREIRLSRRDLGKDWRVLRAWVDGPECMNLRVEPMDAAPRVTGEVTYRLTGVGRIPDASKSNTFRFDVVFETNVPGQPRVAVPVNGHVRLTPTATESADTEDH